MLSFKQYLDAKKQLPKILKVDLSTMSDKDRKQYERIQKKSLQTTNIEDYTQP